MSDTQTEHHTPPRIALFGRVGCHLCDDAREVVQRVATETGEEWHELDVDSVPGLQAKFGDLVPVVMVDGRQVDFHRVDPERLRAALADVSRPRPGRFCG